MTSKNFTRKDAHKKARIGNKWRKPKGLQNKMRLQKKNRPQKVKPGFGTKNEEKHKDKKGLEIIQIQTKEDLKNINPKKQTILIPNLGAKKKLDLIAEAEKQKITIHNLNIKRYKTNIQEERKQKEQKQKEREEKQKTKVKQEKEAEMKKSDTNSKKTDGTKPEKQTTNTEQTGNDPKPNEKSAEEKKKEAKQEKDKILTKAK